MSELFHPLAAIFPLLSGPPFGVLVEDIKQNGLREPIWRHRGARSVERARVVLDNGDREPDHAALSPPLSRWCKRAGFPMRPAPHVGAALDVN